jgi:hypothetical protein
MDVISDLFATLWKMFAADVPLTLATLAIVAVVGAAWKVGALAAPLAPILLATLVLTALTVAILVAARNSSRKGK